MLWYLDRIIANPEYVPSSLPPKESWGKRITIREIKNITDKTAIFKWGISFISFFIKRKKTKLNKVDVNKEIKMYSILNWFIQVRNKAWVKKISTKIAAQKKNIVNHFSIFSIINFFCHPYFGSCLNFLILIYI